MEEQTPYKVVQMDSGGTALAEETILAESYAKALRKLQRINSDAFRLVVFNSSGEKAGEAMADYWQQNIRR